VDLDACREPSKDAVALHAHEPVGGGRRAVGKSNRPWPKPVGTPLRAAGGDHIYRLLSAAGGGSQTAGKHYKFRDWKVLPKRLGGLWNLLESSWDAGISSGAVFTAPGVLLKAFSILLRTSGAVCGPFGHLLGRLGSLLGPSWEPLGQLLGPKMVTTIASGDNIGPCGPHDILTTSFFDSLGTQNLAKTSQNLPQDLPKWS